MEQPTNEQVAASEVKSEEQVGHPHPRDSVTPPEGVGRQQVAEDTLAVKGLTLKMQTSGEEAELTARTDGDTTNRSEVKGSGVQGSLSSRQSTPRTGQRPTSGLVKSIFLPTFVVIPLYIHTHIYFFTKPKVTL